MRSALERRSFLAGAALVTVLPLASARATPEAMTAAIKEVMGGAPIREGRVKLDLPPLVENGNAVPLTVSVESPMTPADHIKAIHVFNEKNPQPHVFDARLGPRNGRARGRHADKTRRYAEDHRHRRDQHRPVLERQRRCDRHAGGLHRGH